ncbi:hypothetical protein GOP47_0005252 [Adiantum capillus-veneris]|uniref:Uncharacterized protein n=1 Tax=Adiantum capillus-veneris TaxID=13818 RepID=A0A9D4V5W8_ADICA|nr:hypothetical protein GOP47_0005252 [Adiantum capillus-veneris]
MVVSATEKNQNLDEFVHGGKPRHIRIFDIEDDNEIPRLEQDHENDDEIIRREEEDEVDVKEWAAEIVCRCVYGSSSGK